MRIAIILLVSLLVGPNTVSQTNPSEHIAVKGTRISLIPPTGFIPSVQQPGFWQEATGSLILVAEFPSSFAEMAAGFSNVTELEKRGMTVLKHHEVSVDKQKGLLVHLEQKALGTQYRKWILVLGDQNESLIITATFPKELESNLSEKMKTTVLTAKWDKEKNVAPTEGLNFTFIEKGELKLAKRIANTVIFTKSGGFPSKDIDEPLFIIGQALSKVEVDNNEEFAKSRLSQTATITDIQIEQLMPVTIDDLKGYEITARGKDRESSQSMAIYQIVLFENQSYYIMQGLVSSKNRQSYLATFKAMSESFKRKK